MMDGRSYINQSMEMCASNMGVEQKVHFKNVKAHFKTMLPYLMSCLCDFIYFDSLAVTIDERYHPPEFHALPAPKSVSIF